MLPNPFLTRSSNPFLKANPFPPWFGDIMEPVEEQVRKRGTGSLVFYIYISINYRTRCYVPLFAKSIYLVSRRGDHGVEIMVI